MSPKDINRFEDILHLKKQDKTLCFVSGDFNIIHPGHIRFLMFAAEQADVLIVGLHDRDCSISAYFENEERLASLQALNFIDYVVVLHNDIHEKLLSLQPDVVVKGKEYEELENDELTTLKQYGGRLLFSSGEKQFSSRELLLNQVNEASAVHIAIQKYHRRYQLDKTILNNALANVNNLKVAVFGDLIVDEYQECLAIGMSQEDPTIAVSPLESFKYLGGAGIVGAHAANLGAEVDFYSVCGTDPLGEFAREKLSEYGVSGLLINDSSRPTTHKLRYRAKGKTLLRVNNYRRHDISQDLATQLIHVFTANIEQYDLVIFSDFSFGVTSTNLIKTINALCLEHKVSMVADSQTSSQVGDLTKFKNLLLTTPTEIEARQAAQDDTNGLIQVSSDLTSKLNADNLIVTLGAEGVLIRHRGETLETDNLPAFSDNAIDTAGAGDAFLVTTSLMLKGGANIWQAAFVGNIASSVQVNIRGNVPLTKKLIIEQIDRFIK